ncbi:fibulin-2-like [Ostrinia furnacalis]|uniref:fibulin-2-like n=1 Tax=Ostrinia furnacalis TaxID=93504 RepID=UPI001039B3D8|nr:fibulin-2-like [Ostrinia furnacalis]
MWCVLWMLAVVSLPHVQAGLAEDMAATTQQCCSKGTAYARTHSSEDCSSSIPPEVPPMFGSLCIFAMDQCCKEYFIKKVDCDSGIDMATSLRCDSSNNVTKSCCNECLRGSSGDACSAEVRGNSAEEVLVGEAYAQCCKKASSESERAKSVETHTQRTEETATVSKKHVLPSLCEEYAPNELCAHHCIPVPGSYKCECNPGFMLMADGRNCKEVVTNRCKQRNPCQHKCIDTGVEVKCSCRRGYELMADKKSCQDIDECVLDPPVCLPDTDCHNIQGSYRCIPKKNHVANKGQCPPGFSRNIANNACDDINECKLPHPPCPSYLCENTIGGYKCGGVSGDPVNLANQTPKPPTEDICPPGFRTGVNEECEDVDECATNKDDCNRISQFCINTRGSFYCQDQASKYCPPGFKIDPRTNKCEDIDECEDSEDVCRPDQVCVNELGLYHCRPKSQITRTSTHDCPDGMRQKPGSFLCEDIDECVEGTHLCDPYQNCLNTNGSHECHCKLGFELDATTGACVDVNECATEQHSCIPETQRCDNTVGSFLCIRFTSCGTGYILHHSSGQCEDVDECAVGKHNCARAGPAYQCVNIPGSFRCVRKKPSTTSTTTPQPVYEYYYDSEEEIEENETNPQPAEPSNPPEVSSTTTTPKPTSEAPQTTPSTRPTETPPPETPPPYVPEPEAPEDREERTNEIIPRPTEPTFQPHTPIYTLHEYIPPPPPTESSPEPDHPSEAPSTERIPEPEVPQGPRPTYSPFAPRDPNIGYRPESRPEYNESVQPDQTEPETTYSPVSSSSPVATPPSVVYVDVGKETATIRGDRKEDGSVVVDTQNIPKNEWTKINERPTNCQRGFELDEYGACYDIDECSTNRHSCSGLTEVCRNTMGGYICECALGYRRDLYTGACDVIPTTTSTTTTSTTLPPPTIVTTTEKPKSYYFWGYPEYRPLTQRPFRPRNPCDAGFHLNSQTGICEDVNECVNGQADCAAVEICVNTQGGYRCECPPNWHLDDVKHRCVPNRTDDQFPTGYGNEPKQPVYPPIEPQAPVGPGSTNDLVEPGITQVEDRGSVIKCPWGYRLGDDNTCEDIDECSTGEAKCGPIQWCINLPGGYTCNCPTGHKLTGDHECEEIDECALAGNMPICSQNADCINTVGSYKCRCHDGFRSAPVNDKVCVDVDECTENRAGTLCEHRCNNVWGGYRCSCHRGYRLNADNSTCADVNECEEFKSKALCVGRCLNEPGSYRCSCPSGYRLSEDKRSCIDIDECETGEATCASSSPWSSGASYVCLNTRGSYRCHHIVCPPGYQLESKNRCTKVERVCPPADWECAHQPSTYSYNFITFVSNLYIPASKVDLFTMRGPTWPHAQIRFQLRLVDSNAPPSVKRKADINSFLLVQSGHQGVVSLVRSLEGPQSIELELIMELYNRDQFGGIAVAKIFIFVSEYEF